MASSSPRCIDLLKWWIVLVLAAGGTLFALAQNLDEEPKIWWLLYSFPPVGIAAMARASREAFQHSRRVRVVHWLLTFAVIVLLMQFARAQWQLMERSGYDTDLLRIAIVIGLISCGILWLKRARRQHPALRCADFLRDGVWTAGWAALLIAGSLGALALFVLSKEREAQRAWKACGRPMDEFAAQMGAVAENESLRELERDLSAFGVQDIYRREDAASIPDRLTPPPELFRLISADGTQGDTVAPSAAVTHYFSERAGALSNLYGSVLHRTPPLWAIDPSADDTLRVPNFLVLRKLSQIIHGDALEKIRRGDDDAAFQAIAAGLRITESLRHHPTVVAQMIRCAVEPLFVSAYARLQKDPESTFDGLAGRNCQQAREDFRRSFQAEAWIASHRVSRLDDVEAMTIAEAQMRFWIPWFSHGAKIKLPVPKWLAPLLVRLDVANASIGMAGAVRVTCDERNLSAPCFGMKGVEPTGPFSQSSGLPNCVRAWSRLNASLLLREQAEIIRRLRPALSASAGEVSGEAVSEALPGTKWTFRSNGARSVIIRLQAIPEGLLEVAPMTFFLSPIDGSASWQFVPRSAAGTASEPLPPD